MKKNNVEETQQILFKDDFKGIKKLYFTNKGYFLLSNVLFWGLLVDVFIVFIVSGLHQTICITFLFLPLWAFIVWRFYYCSEETFSVTVDKNNLRRSKMKVGLIPFPKIKKIELKDKKEKFTTFFVVTYVNKSGKLYAHTLHIKDTEGFLSTLRQIYGEEKWKEIFVDET